MLGTDNLRVINYDSNSNSSVLSILIVSFIVIFLLFVFFYFFNELRFVNSRIEDNYNRVTFSLV